MDILEPTCSGSARMYPDMFIDMVNARLADLPSAQRKIGEAFIKQPELLGCFSLVELAHRTNTSQASIIRFCRSLGFDGFLQFTKEVQQALQTHLSVTDRFSLNESRSIGKKVSGKREINNDISRLLLIGKNNIDALEETVRGPHFKSTVEAMHQADTIFILGRMSSYPLAFHFAQMLSKITPNITLLDRGMMQVMAEFNKVTEKSVLFAILFPRYPSSSLNIARQMAERGATIVSVTNSRLCPTVPFSAYTLLTPLDVVSYIDVFISPVTLLSALAIAFGGRRPELSQRYLGAFDAFAEENSLFVK